MRIAIYHNLHSGGAKRVAADHFRWLGLGHELCMFSLASADHDFAMQKPGSQDELTTLDGHLLRMARSPFGRINPLIRMVNLTRLAAVERKMAALIDGQGFDVILVHPSQATQAPYVLKFLRTPATYYCHELPRRLYEKPVPRPYGRRSALRRAIDRVDPLPFLYNQALRSADRKNAMQSTSLVANSQYTRGNVLRAYGREAEVCPPGIDTQFFQAKKVERERFVLSVGALTPLKGFDFIIESVATFPTSARSTVVIISNYQEPEELSYLKELAQGLGVRVEFLAGIPDAELVDWYAKAGCVAYAPIREPLGLIPLEAMAAGAPVVGIEEGGVKETVIPGVTGLLAPRSPAAFGQALSEVIDQPADAQRLGDSARQYVLENWTWPKRIGQLETCLAQAAARSAWD